MRDRLSVVSPPPPKVPKLPIAGITAARIIGLVLLGSEYTTQVKFSALTAATAAIFPAPRNGHAHKLHSTQLCFINAAKG